MKVLEMFSYVRVWAALRSDNRGVTAVEYGIMAALIATILVAAMASLGGGLSSAFTAIANTLKTLK